MLPSLVTEDNVREALKQVFDPELGVSILDLGLVYGVAIDGSQVKVTMTMTTAGCPLQTSLAEAVESAVKLLVPGVDTVNVEVVWDPPWTPERMTPEGQRQLGWF